MSKAGDIKRTAAVAALIKWIFTRSCPGSVSGMALSVPGQYRTERRYAPPITKFNPLRNSGNAESHLKYFSKVSVKFTLQHSK